MIGPGPAGDSALREGVAEELDRLEKPRTNAAQGLLVLALTAFLFAGTHALADAGWVTILLVVLVLAFHELGHLVAMRAFGYQDTRIFFIPFFGAAAAGRKHDATGSQRALVLLAGPLPGLLAGFLLGCWLLVTGTSSVTLESLGGLLLFINAFNLLPFHPLDGGQFLNVVLFSRWPALEALVRVLGALLLAGIAYRLGSWVLAIVALFILMATPLRLRLTRAARVLDSEIPAAELVGPAIPRERRETVALLVEKEIERVPGSFKPRTFASLMQSLWLCAQQRPPSAAPTVALLAVYLIFTAGAGAVLWFTWQMHIATEGETLLASERVHGTVPGRWEKVGETAPGEEPWSVGFERADGAHLGIMVLGPAPLDAEHLEEMASRSRNQGMAVTLGTASDARMVVRGTEDGEAFRGRLLERNGLAWLVMYSDAASTPESEIDLQADLILKGLDLR